MAACCQAPASFDHPDFWLAPLAILLFRAAYAINRAGNYRLGGPADADGCFG